MAKNDLRWINIDMEDMSPPVRKAYDAIETAKATFEKEVTKSLKKSGEMQDGDGAKFSYKHGSVGVGVGEVSEGRKKVRV